MRGRGPYAKEPFMRVESPGRTCHFPQRLLIVFCQGLASPKLTGIRSSRTVSAGVTLVL